jgi:hypothetical protein
MVCIIQSVRTTIPIKSLAAFEAYTFELRRMLFEPGLKAKDQRLLAALDGEPSRRLRKSVGGEILRETGTFFTGARVSAKVLQRVVPTSSGGGVDPACGAGDLLLALARHLPVFPTLEETMEEWTLRLGGCDIHRPFVNATKARLCLLALRRGAQPPDSRVAFSKVLTNISYGDGMRLTPLSEPRLVVMNPPYTRVPAPETCEWAEGLVSSAALFVDRWLDLIPSSGRLIAILPDVLRTGSNYRAWRESVLRRANVSTLEILGRFDQSADVDVFAATFVVGVSRVPVAHTGWKWMKKSHSDTVGDRFSVNVGRIVPHRDRNAGRQYAYLNAKGAPAWGIRKRIAAKILSERGGFRPPLVVVRRTSSPGDSMRAIGTIVSGKRDIAVENHLLVLSPHNRTVRECEKLIRVLKSADTTKWLNQRIRCRHLTVEAVRAIPWWTD